MSDTAYVPGLTDKYKSSESIKKIMESKTKKLEKMEDEKKSLVDEKNLWSELKTKFLSLQNKAKKLYGFEAPFDDKVSQSSDPNAFSATVKRVAEIGEYRIEIINKATSYKIASSSLSKSYKIPAGEYAFSVDNEKFKFYFEGGTIDNFSEAIKKNAKNILKSVVANDTKNTQVLILETVKFGEKKYISFDNEKTKEVFKDMGFFENVKSYEKEFSFDKRNLINQTKSSLNLVENTLKLDTNDKIKFTLPEKIEYRENLVMEIDIRVDVIDPSKKPKEETPTGPNWTREGDTTIFDINIEGETLISNVPPYTKKEDDKPKQIIYDDHYIDIITNKRTIEFPELDVNETKKTLRFDMNNFINDDETIVAVVFKNLNTYKKLEVSNLKFYDSETIKGIKYKNELSKPMDATIKIDGLIVKRDTNTVDDLIKGVTINIFDKTKKEESLKIDRDYEKIVKTIDDFIAEYNQILDYVNNQTKIEAKEYRDESDKKNMGVLANDSGLKTFITKIRVIMMNPYPTYLGSEFSLLKHIGISTNETSTTLDVTKLKGYLELNPDKLIESIEKYPEAVKQLFGYDTDGDIIIDSGIAFETEKLLKSYTQKDRGYFDSKTALINNKIQRQDKDIEDYKKKLAEEEQKLKEQFYKMEKAANELEESRKKFDNFNK